MADYIYRADRPLRFISNESVLDQLTEDTDSDILMSYYASVHVFSHLDPLPPVGLAENGKAKLQLELP